MLRGERILKQPDSHVGMECDPLLYRTGLSCCLTLHPLGFPVRVESNSSEVISGLEESWGGFQKEFDAPPVELSVIVSASTNQALLSPPVFRCRRHVLTVVADAENFAACDLNSGYGCAWITTQTAKDSAYLRDSFTEALLLSMLNTRHLSPVHAACAVRDGTGVLLCGDSGSGKSSLALACALRGWALLCDDASFLVRSLGGCTVVGNPFIMRFKPDAVRLFPQLGGRTAVARLNGKPTIHLRTSEFPQIETVQRAEVRFLAFLRRGVQVEARLVRREADSQPLPQLTEYGDVNDTIEQHEARRALSSLPAYDLFYCELDEAVEQLDAIFRSGGEL
ncbi:MAG: hypothetical protein IH602_11285 [Bryobacteraceae bacterium]|nr:hypothetical protein [Bryobacteraceae bacterium]